MLVSDLMTTELVTAKPTMTLKDTDALLTRHGVSGAPVVDGDTLVGVISQSDIVRVLYDQQVATAHASQYLLSPYPIALPALTELTRERARIADRLVETKVSEVMTTDPVTVSPDDDLAAAASVMCDKGVHRVLVTDNGRLVGLLSSLDLAGTLIEG